MYKVILCTELNIRIIPYAQFDLLILSLTSLQNIDLILKDIIRVFYIISKKRDYIKLDIINNRR